MDNLFASKTWVLIRVIVHLICVIPLIYIWHTVINRDLYTVILVFFLIAVYVALIWAQIKTPLISISNGLFCYNNFFYTGTQKFSLDEIESIKLVKGRMILTALNKSISVNLLGINKQEADEIINTFHNYISI